MDPEALTGKPFRGRFNGLGHTIIVNIQSDAVASGLFGYIYKGTITDLEVRGTVNGSGKYVGGIVGVNHGIVEGCSFIGDVTSTSSDGNAATGGLIGWNGYDGKCYVMNSSHIGKVTANNGNVGGIVGLNESFGDCYAEINRCFHTNGDVDGGKYCGGIGCLLFGDLLLFRDS